MYPFSGSAKIAEVKACLNDCSGKGECVFTDWIGNEVLVCAESDSSCRASCICDLDSYGADCSYDEVSFVEAREAKELICSLSNSAIGLVDVSEGIKLLVLRM